jgi:hypothetical protein
MTNVAWITPVVAARLMGTGPKEAVHACGLSVATSAVLNTWLRPTHTIPMIKGVAVGLVLERALEAAELARLGVTATEDALETAFSRLLPDGPTGVVESRLKQLGSRWTTTRNLIKVYPAQLYTQPRSRRPLACIKTVFVLTECESSFSMQPKRLRRRPGFAASVCTRKSGGCGSQYPLRSSDGAPSRPADLSGVR